MILLDVKRYIREHQQVSAEDLKNRFDVDDQALDGLLDPLIHQGHVQVIDSDGETCSSGACSSCSASAKLMVYWTDKRLKRVNIPIQVNT